MNFVFNQKYKIIYVYMNLNILRLIFKVDYYHLYFLKESY